MIADVIFVCIAYIILYGINMPPYTMPVKLLMATLILVLCVVLTQGPYLEHWRPL
jgi:hypothetical protein